MLPQLVLDLITCFTGFANHRVLLEVIPLASPCYLLQPASASFCPKRPTLQPVGFYPRASCNVATKGAASALSLADPSQAGAG